MVLSTVTDATDGIEHCHGWYPICILHSYIDWTAPESTGQRRTQHWTAPDSTGQHIGQHRTWQRMMLSRMNRTHRTQFRTHRTSFRTTFRTRTDTEPDIHRTFTGHNRTLPDKPDNRTPRAQPGSDQKYFVLTNFGTRPTVVSISK